jgi:hypothetical protein
MQARRLAPLFWTAFLLAPASGCDERDENGKLKEPREAHVLTGRLDVALVSNGDAIPVAETPGSLTIPDPTGRSSLVLSAPSWQIVLLLVGRCEGACADPTSKAWLKPSNDALYGTEFHCDPSTGCMDDPDDFGLRSLAYGSCPAGFVHKAQPIQNDLMDFTDATACAEPPVLEEGGTYYFLGVGTACNNSDFNDCDEIRGVRFFTIEDGAVVDLGGNGDDRRLVYGEEE